MHNNMAALKVDGCVEHQESSISMDTPSDNIYYFKQLVGYYFSPVMMLRNFFLFFLCFFFDE